MKDASRVNSRAEPYRLSPDQLRWKCDPRRLPFKTTAELDESQMRIIGQPRAKEALQLGLELQGSGYHIFVSGEVGTGRSTVVRTEIEQAVLGDEVPPDLCYVNNFQDPVRPQLLQLPPGKGQKLRKAMEQLLEDLSKNLPDLFAAESSQERRKQVTESERAQHKELVREFEARAKEEGFALVLAQSEDSIQPVLLPLVGQEKMPMEKVAALVSEGKFLRKEFEVLREKYSSLSGELQRLHRKLIRAQRKLAEKLSELDRELVKPLVRQVVQEVRDAVGEEAIESYLVDVEKDLLENLERFERPSSPPSTETEARVRESRARRQVVVYAVNVLVDNSDGEGPPVRWDKAPSYSELFGSIDASRDVTGEWYTDHTQIKAGALIRANGGILVLDAMDVLAEPAVWPTLKRSLRHREQEIRTATPVRMFSGLTLEPEPVPIRIKMVLIGTPYIHRLLYRLDEDFKKIFKVKAEMALETARNRDEILNYSRFVKKLCRNEKLRPFHRSAVARIVEYGVRLAGRQNKLSTRFNAIADLVQESHYWARQNDAETVERRHVQKAIEHKRWRLDRIEELLRERIEQGSVLVSLKGEKVGQINGLVVLDLGDHRFGLPSRITASTAMGRAGIISIEREAHMSGSIHTKGMLILSGFLRSRFAQDKPLTLSASLAFEQSYGGVDGDSASSAELLALLSSLSGVTIRQNIAVTGSVNQKGEIQPIGGVNEKIEGFFDLCRLNGLDGKQGVMIPTTNVPDLMLRHDVVRAVKEGQFHIYAIARIEEGVEILLGRSAGERNRDGTYPEETVFAEVDARLSSLADGVGRYGAADLRLGV